MSPRRLFFHLFALKRYRLDLPALLSSHLRCCGKKSGSRIKGCLSSSRLNEEQSNIQKICGSSYPLSIAFIVVNEFCERFSYYGMKAVLTLYFLYFLHWSEDTSTSVYHAFSSLCYFTPILGAAIADSWLGKFKTIIYLSLVYVLGHVLKSLGAIPILGGKMAHTILSLIGLSLIALGTGGIKPCVAAFGGDQFEEKHAEERTRYFSVFYLSINAGSLISTFITPMLRGDVQCFGEDCYALAFGVPGLLMVIALVVFAMGSKMYKKPPPEGNVVAQVIKCVGFAISNRFKNRSQNIPRRPHWLDWAAEKYPKHLIMDVKALTRILFLYIPLPMFWALLDQQGSRWTLQATKMNGDLGFFVLQPDQMQVLNPFLVLIFIPLFDLVIYRLIAKCGIKFSSLRKMAVGMILACLAFAVAAIVEIKINVKDVENKTINGMTAVRFINTLHKDVTISLGTDGPITVDKDYGVSAYRTIPRGEYSAVPCKTEDKDFSLNLGLLDFGASYLLVITNVSNKGLQAWKREDILANQMSIAWQLPQYALVTAAEVMFSVTGLEFSYSQAPSSMKSVLQAAWLLTVAFGNIIVLVVAQFSGLVQWAEFILFSCLLLVVCLIFSIMSYYYVPINSEEIHGPENKHHLHMQGKMVNLETKNTKL
ncbi:PREDICTED: solute carrier family 15 member 2 isoform X3 [Chinchilla lanigera]|uniref:solute carrier family 15 member 2 isoform X3 n=1 Tax=Chinchilla lanigera TaxID=34839 RepID=UPI00069750CA|nr:PREDICTED: solute carrier family 15 member 2 isoform X3 [Chinchilla lanigera]